MEKSKFESETKTLSPSRSVGRRNVPNSPEFEFWMVRNPSFPQPHLLFAEELFVNGVILPLNLLSQHSDSPTDSDPKPNHQPDHEPEPSPEPGPEPGPEPDSSTVLSTSKRWRDIFKLGEKKTTTNATSNNIEDKNRDKDKDKEKKKKKERKSGNGGSVTAELNINIWPFSRSRSAGNNGNRPKMGCKATTRKVSSAPCSRSNSAGESKSKKWPSSPGHGGIHLGRSSPVWQVQRGSQGWKSSEPVVRNSGGDARVRVSNLKFSCGSDENRLIGGDVGGEKYSSRGTGNSGNGGKLFNLRTLFSKKVY